jgi:probable phosphoglycerate mutase
MKRIVTIQHTQSVHHTNGMIGSWTDWELTDLGKGQADRIGRRLAEELRGGTFSLYSSDLLRARQTAEAIARHAGGGPVFLEALRERNLGSAVGRSVAWFRENARLPERTVDDRCLEDAESRRDVWNRLVPCLARFREDDSDTVLVVSHGDALCVFNTLWLGLPVETLDTCGLVGAAGGVSVFQEDSRGRRVLLHMSDMSYIA